MNQPIGGESLKAYQKMCKVWEAFENVELQDISHLQPHAILYGGGSEMDIFLTFSPGFLKFVNKMEEVPIKSSSYWFWSSTYAHFCHFETPAFLIESQYATQNISISDLSSSPLPIKVETWCYHDPDEVVKIYACEQSTVFRLSLPTIESETFAQDLASYITKSLQEGVYMVPPPGGAKNVDWRVGTDIIDCLVKTQNHKFIKYITRPFYKLFQNSVSECRAERNEHKY